MKGQIRVYYDEEGDYLEMRVGEPSGNYGVDGDDGTVIFKSDTDDEVVGVGIFGFKTRTKDLQEIEIPLPFNIAMKSL